MALIGLFISSVCILIGCNSERVNPIISEPDDQVTIQAHHLSVEEAQQIALTFIKGSDTFGADLRASSETDITLAFAEPKSMSGLRASSTEAPTDDRSTLPAYYVFNISEKGFVIVSAWDVTFPILGYSAEGNFFGEDIAIAQSNPEAQNIMSFLSSYAESIDSLRQVTHITKELREAYTTSLKGEVVGDALRATNNIAPLLGDIKWNQSPYYNAYCPTGTPVGCVATATSQIMRYWKYPPRGTGSHTSTSDGLYANFNKSYNWDNMPAATLRQQNHDVAQLCYDVAVGLNMQFSQYGSGTWQYYVPTLLVDHFYYKNTAKDIYRSNYSSNQWVNIVYNELANDRPVQYAGAGSTGAGHSFVCDGYANGYFHINWGWGGMSDGYFLLHALDPYSLGTGGGNGGYNYGQDIVIGIEPNQKPNPNPDPETSEIKYLLLSQFKNMLTFGANNQVAFGYGYNGPMVVFIKATGCSYCETTRPSIELLAKEYKGKVPFYGFDVVTDNQWGANWDYVQRVLGIETVPQLLFITKEGTYTLKNGVINTSNASEGAKIFRPYVEALLSGGDEPTPTPSGEYCTSMGRYARSTYIAQVSLNGMTNITASNKGGYNYFENKTIELTPGKTYNMTIKPGSLSGSYPEYFRVWIDYNGDKNFTSEELLLDFTTTQSNVAVTKQFTLPQEATAGNARMRVSMKWGSAPDACETFDHGEVEDYPVIIKDEVTPEPEPEPEPEVDPYPVSYGKNSAYAFISSVNIGDMTNTGTKGDNYASYINTHHITGQPGRALSFQLTPTFGTSQTYWCYWRIWIDYNKDGKFSSNELVASKYGYRYVSGWFTLPYRMDPGLYRVRVSMKMNDGYPAPDEIFNYGEVEDYRLRIN